MRFSRPISIFLFSALLPISDPVAAQVSVSDAWVRATVQEQKISGAYMTLTAAQDARLVGASSRAAGAVEIHRTSMESNTARMRRAAAIDLPAGKSVQLRPGGYHIMLLNLKRQLKEGDSVAIRLVIEDKSGKPSRLEVKALVRPIGADSGPAHAH